jgi:hypothetical protein
VSFGPPKYKRERGSQESYLITQAYYGVSKLDEAIQVIPSVVTWVVLSRQVTEQLASIRA